MENRLECANGEKAGKQEQQPARPPSPPARYKGVRMRKWGKWVAEVRYPKSRQRLWLGSYPTPEMAAMAYDAAVYCLRGPGEALNVPAHPPNIPSADRLSRYEIREAARLHAQLAKRPDEATIGATEGAGEESSSGPAVTPLPDLIDPAMYPSGADWTGVEGSFLRGGGGNHDDHDNDYDGDIFGYIPLWNFDN